MGLFVPTDYPAYAKTSSIEFKNWMVDTYKFIAAIYNFTHVSSDYGASAFDYIVSVDCSGGNRTITLPDPREVVGKKYVIVKYDSTANDIILSTRNSQNIEGAAADYTFAANRGRSPGKSKTLLSLGTKGWWTIGSVDGIFELASGELAD